MQVWQTINKVTKNYIQLKTADLNATIHKKKVFFVVFLLRKKKDIQNLNTISQKMIQMITKNVHDIENNNNQSKQK